jgi:YrbI family 3-deoxy-D-manno-octulosonate 8-phosphate phosphatase
MKFVIAGLGSIGQRHLRNLLRLGERDIVLLRTFKGKLSAGDLTDFPSETNLDAALSHRPDAVIVANPTALHMDIAIPAAEAGCHILIEKPISNRLEHIGYLKKAMKKSGARVLVGFHFRFHPHFQKVQALLKKGGIGRPLSAHAHYGDYLPDWHPWEDYRKGYSAREELGGGVLLTLCHPLDYLMWFLGEAVSLWKKTSKLSQLDIQVDDAAEVGFRFGNGGIGSVHLNYYQRPPAHRFEIVGTEGTIRWTQDDNILRIFSVKSGTWSAIPGPPEFDRNDMFLSEMRHFLEMVRANAPPICPLEDGERVLRLILTADQPGEGLLSEIDRARPFPKHVSAVVFDFDGVMTDNRAWVDEQGYEQVAINRSDGLGLALLRHEGEIEVIVMSTETNATVAARCRKLGIPVLRGLSDKAGALKQWMEERAIDPAQVIYVGNDVNDLPCFPLVGFTFAPADAHPEVRRRADYVLKYQGGKGAVREICDLLISRSLSVGNKGSG